MMNWMPVVLLVNYKTAASLVSRKKLKIDDDDTLNMKGMSLVLMLSVEEDGTLIQ